MAFDNIYISFNLDDWNAVPNCDSSVWGCVVKLFTLFPLRILVRTSNRSWTRQRKNPVVVLMEFFFFQNEFSKWCSRWNKNCWVASTDKYIFIIICKEDLRTEWHSVSVNKCTQNVHVLGTENRKKKCSKYNSKYCPSVGFDRTRRQITWRRVNIVSFSAVRLAAKHDCFYLSDFDFTVKCFLAFYLQRVHIVFNNDIMKRTSEHRWAKLRCSIDFTAELEG